MNTKKDCCEKPRKTLSISTRKGRRLICNSCGAPWPKEDRHADSTKICKDKCQEKECNLPEGHPGLHISEDKEPFSDTSATTSYDDQYLKESVETLGIHLPYFTTQALSEFRENLCEKWFDLQKYKRGEYDEEMCAWLSSKLYEAPSRQELIEANTRGFEDGKKNERSRIINLIEGKLNDPPAESIDHTDGYMTALDSLLEEIGDFPGENE